LEADLYSTTLTSSQNPSRSCPAWPNCRRILSTATSSWEPCPTHPHLVQTPANAYALYMMAKNQVSKAGDLLGLELLHAWTTIPEHCSSLTLRKSSQPSWRISGRQITIGPHLRRSSDILSTTTSSCLRIGPCNKLYHNKGGHLKTDNSLYSD
jgi:hypothetical protein